MINNRQNGRRRGRGGPQARNGSGGSNPERGNRIDNRARGNAAQLHEKYKNLARDAQMQGDRVMTEYYLQFADHYFRVLGESRARFEEQNQNQPQQRRQNGQQDGFDDDVVDDQDGDFGDAELVAEPRRFDREPRRETRDERPREDRGNREERTARDDRGNREDRGNRDDSYREPREDVTEVVSSDEQEEAPRPRRGRRPRRPEGAEASPAPANEDRAPRIDVDRLPPAFAPVEAPSSGSSDGEGDDPAPRRRRVRRPSSEDNVAA